MFICIHVYNNPHGYVDPSGHCGADENWIYDNDSQMWVDNNAQATEDCFDLRDDLEALYDINISGQWSLEEIQVLQGALKLIFDKLFDLGIVYTQGAFQELFGSTNIHRARKDGVTLSSSCPSGALICNVFSNAHVGLFGDITLFNGAFERGELASYETIVHELGHVWDAKNNYTISQGIKEATNSSFENCGLFCRRYRTGDQFVNTNPNEKEHLANAFEDFVLGKDLSVDASIFLNQQLTKNFQTIVD